MVKFKFFVHCIGCAAGGYENTHFAENEQEARETIDRWNKPYRMRGMEPPIELLSVEEISDKEFVEDYIPAYF